ncbi:penicillin-binding protein [Anaeromyxobacter paludicola]|uniref:Penicillin-binding protein n=1 Tax=Anaeromyxobacter paludicola TaxID=2918171 RepID=A0ABM7XEM5_9BACT|nr:penicillin-binding protein [Anaeromyxobacter paludicola]
MDAQAAKGVAFRMWIVAAALAAGLVTVAVRAVQLQVVQKDHLGGMARDQYVRPIELKPRRGVITDRNGAALAADVQADSVFVDPKDLPPDPARGPAVARLARTLGVDPGPLLRRIAVSRRFAWAKRRVTPAESAAVKALGIPGVHFVQEYKRTYPRGELAGQVLGVVGDDGEGLEGVELSLDDDLQGEAVRLDSLRDGRARALYPERGGAGRVREGARVELTLDQGLQHAAEQSLAAAVQGARARAGMAVALDPHTGEILALANAPLANPNAVRHPAELRNHAVQDAFEPGSTFKVFSVAGALEERAVGPEDSIFCENGAWRVGRHTIHDHHGLGWVTPARILAESSNVGAGKIAARLGREKLYRTYLAFGFGAPTEVGVQAEARGTVNAPRADISLATMSFGQGVTASALQITAAMAAIANDGLLLRPWLVRRVVDPADGTELLHATPTPVRRAVSPQTARTMARFLEGVVVEGTGKKARLAGWRAAGKTGTAQKADPLGGYSADKRFSSFVGFAPAEAPRVVIGVFIDEPKGDVYGGDVAAPVFKALAETALQSMGVPPSAQLPAVAKAGAPSRATPVEPEPDFPVVESAAQEAERARRAEQGGVAVPALAGLPARAALRALEQAELMGELAGSGRVESQFPRPGEVVDRGTRVRLHLAPPG